MIQALQLIVALSFLVMIHELGHFTFARLFGVRVEKFYMFFNPWLSLFSMKKFDGKWHFRFLHKNVENDPWDAHPETTEWGIGWLPFGGYCAISGMVDETHDAADVAKSEPQPWEFRSKNVFQRFGIIIGGILVNFVAALLIFGLLFYHTGSDRLPLKNAQQGLYFANLMLEEGFRQQDKVLTVDGVEPETLPDLVNAIIIEGKREVTVLRGTDTIGLTMSKDLGQRYLTEQNEHDRRERQHQREDTRYHKMPFVLMGEYFPMVIDSVMPDMVADFAGLKSGDSIVSVSGISTPSFYEVQDELRKYPCDSVSIGFVRNGVLLECGAFLGDQCKLGIVPKSKYDYCPLEHKDYGFFEAMGSGIRFGWSFLVKYVHQFRLVFSKEGAQSLGGFGAIGSMFPDRWNWYLFWNMTAVLSLILAFMNFLPIPALDGGYILFLIVEMITGKKPSDKFLEVANNIGFWLLIALMILANSNDILKIFF